MEPRSFLGGFLGGTMRSEGHLFLRRQPWQFGGLRCDVADLRLSIDCPSGLLQYTLVIAYIHTTDIYIYTCEYICLCMLMQHVYIYMERDGGGSGAVPVRAWFEGIRLGTSPVAMQRRHAVLSTPPSLQGRVWVYI